MFNYPFCITPATFSPVNTEDVQLWIRSNIVSEVGLLQRLIDGAVDQFFNDTQGYVLCSSSWQLNLDNWNYHWNRTGDGFVPYEMLLVEPEFVLGHPPQVFIPIAPVTSITSVQYLDTNGNWDELTGWTADTSTTPCRIILPTNLPMLYAFSLPRIQIQFVAGNAEHNVPALASQAVLGLVAHWYTNRESTGDELDSLPHGWDSICGRFRTGINVSWNR